MTQRDDNGAPADAAHRDELDRIRSLADCIPQLVWTCLPDGHCDFLNRRWAEFTGVPEAEHHGTGWQAALHPDDRPAVAARWRAFVEGRGDYDVEYRLRRHDGEYRWFKTRGLALRDGAGAVVRVFGTTTDIDDQKRAEQELRESRERLDAALAASGTGTFRWDVTTNALDWDAQLDRLFGLPPGRTARSLDQFLALVHPDDRAGVVERCRRCKDEGADFAMEFRVVWPDGGERWLDDRGKTFRGPDGRPAYVTGACVDVTERKRAEAALKEADRRKEQFLALLAHELRNPLAPLKNGLHVIRLAGGDPAAVARAREMMDRQLGHLVRLVDDLLDVARITQNKLELRRARVTLAEAVASAVETARPALDDAGHELTVSLPAAPVLLDADLTRLSQVFANLLTNAAKYTPRGGRVRLSAQPEAGAVVVSVEDNGIGIPPESLPRIFDMFSQVDRPIERSSGGLGIGLALVRGLVEMHGGTVTAASDGPGAGSTFRVRLPALAGNVRARPSGAGDGAASGGPGRRVLVADDNRDAAESLAILLRLLGHVVRVVHDGAEAVEAVEAFRPEVVLMDVGMPRLNGYDATRRIREQPWSRGVTILALTGWGQDGDRHLSREAGCDGHLVKPLSLDELLPYLSAPQKIRTV